MMTIGVGLRTTRAPWTPVAPVARLIYRADALWVHEPTQTAFADTAYEKGDDAGVGAFGPTERLDSTGAGDGAKRTIGETVRP